MMRHAVLLALLLVAACATPAPEPMLAPEAVAVTAEPVFAEEANSGDALLRTCDAADTGDGIGGTGCPVID